MPRRGALHAADIAATHRQAFDLAFEALERRALREIDRARDGRRRPKKYFVAKRLLESEPVNESVEAPSRARRSA
jgi:ribosome-associated translation inhibitor RaiA